MRIKVKQVFAGLMVVALTGILALANTKTEQVTFAADTMVGSTTIKAGTYDLRFNEKTGELEIWKGSKVMAKTSTHSEKRSDKARSTELHTTAVGNMDQLVGITFRGKEENIVLDQSTPSTTGN